MASFFIILFILLAINAILLIFSVNGSGKRRKAPIQKISENPITKLFPREVPETEYKEAI